MPKNGGDSTLLISVEEFGREKKSPYPGRGDAGCVGSAKSYHLV